MKRRILYISLIFGALIALGIFNRITGKASKNEYEFAEVKRDLFEVSISASGEMEAEKSVEIRGPEISQSGNNMQGRGPGMGMRAADMKIQDLIPEGTLVKAGDYIARLDRTSYTNTLTDALNSLQTEQTNLQTKIIDTAVTLSGLRDAIKNQVYVVEDAEITLQQDKYEPPATIRKAEQALDKAKRSLEQQKISYNLRKRQNIAEIDFQRQKVQNASDLVSSLQDFLSKFTIISPADGMVTYKKDRDGTKRKTGSSLNPFDLVIATLPDLSSLLSKIYVSEIEVTKLKTGMETVVTIDALPGKKYKGHVESIANVGEVLPNSDSKMFEVLIKIDGTDPDLRPSMTTSNKIIIESFDNAIFVPTECLMTGADGIPFVYKKNGTRQVIIPGAANDKYTVIKKGLEEGTLVYTTIPANPESFKLKGKELIAEAGK